ncbi:BON domain-containing protein [Pelagicoccus albus]|uniref:BON domain-containing protein n=1 Tax=Pelagicoccus albus TaxID=415222 RepID=A0A7X1E8H3_9BACT|nr:BON domain-containing protein [Pelagicoccus albus]MBC2606800.1 BON domain-containing protein [Pelagicoccus albus]
MKSFFVALILGIFVGLLINNFFSDPEAYQKLQDEKAALDLPAEIEPPAEPVAEETETPEPAMFEVASEELDMKRDSKESISPRKVPPVVMPEVETLEPAPEEQESADEEPATEVIPEPEISEPAPPEPAPEPPVAEPDEPVAEPEPPVADLPAPIAQVEELSEDVDESISESIDEAADEIAEASEEASEEIEEAVESAEETVQEIAEETVPEIESDVDQAIAAALRGKIVAEANSVGESVSIQVKDRVVTLTGTVPDEATKSQVIELAVYTQGVLGVEEELTIAP